MSKQTAVEWFMDILLDIEEISLSQLKEIERAYLQARQMEKEQTTEAYIAGSHHLPIPSKTYGGDHE